MVSVAPSATQRQCRRSENSRTMAQPQFSGNTLQARLNSLEDLPAYLVDQRLGSLVDGFLDQPVAQRIGQREHHFGARFYRAQPVTALIVYPFHRLPGQDFRGTLFSDGDIKGPVHAYGQHMPAVAPVAEGFDLLDQVGVVGKVFDSLQQRKDTLGWCIENGTVFDGGHAVPYAVLRR